MQTSGRTCRENAIPYSLVVTRDLSAVAQRAKAEGGRSGIPEAAVIEPISRGVLDAPPEPVIGLAEGETRWRGMTVLGRDKASAPKRLQALEGQALGIPDTGQVELADEGNGCLAVAIGQRHDGINGYSLGVHGASSCCQAPPAHTA